MPDKDYSLLSIFYIQVAKLKSQLRHVFAAVPGVNRGSGGNFFRKIFLQFFSGVSIKSGWFNRRFSPWYAAKILKLFSSG